MVRTTTATATKATAPRRGEVEGALDPLPVRDQLAAVDGAPVLPPADGPVCAPAPTGEEPTAVEG